MIVPNLRGLPADREPLYCIDDRRIRLDDDDWYDDLPAGSRQCQHCGVWENDIHGCAFCQPGAVFEETT